MIVRNIVFSIIASVVALLIIGDSMGELLYQTPPSFHYAMVSVAFLFTWLVYGLILGYLGKKNFIKFISVFLAGVSIFAFIGNVLPSKLVSNTILLVLATPGIALIYAPTYGLGYFVPLNPSLNFTLYCLIVLWSSGAVGYLLGILLSNLVLKVSSVNKLSDK